MVSRKVIQVPVPLGGAVRLRIGPAEGPEGVRDARGTGNNTEVLTGGLLVPWQGAAAEVRAEGGGHPARSVRVVVGERVAVEGLEGRVPGRAGGLALARTIRPIASSMRWRVC